MRHQPLRQSETAPRRMRAGRGRATLRGRRRDDRRRAVCARGSAQRSALPCQRPRVAIFLAVNAGGLSACLCPPPPRSKDAELPRARHTGTRAQVRPAPLLVSPSQEQRAALLHAATSAPAWPCRAVAPASARGRDRRAARVSRGAMARRRPAPAPEVTSAPLALLPRAFLPPMQRAPAPGMAPVPVSAVACSRERRSAPSPVWPSKGRPAAAPEAPSGHPPDYERRWQRSQRVPVSGHPPRLDVPACL